MTILEALKLIQRQSQRGAPSLDVFLACGMMPLHLETFLTAHLSAIFPDRAIRLTTGLYGDLVGNLARIKIARPAAAAVVIEWEDLDSRLGIRRPGAWGPGTYTDVLQSASASLARIQSELEQAQCPAALSLPSLSISPLAHNPGWQASSLSAHLAEQLGRFETWGCTKSNLRILSAQRLGETSPPANRYDIASHLTNGFPYTLAHTDVMSELLARLLRNAPPKKALITDLDDTLWSGIVGEVGPDRISWDLDHNSHMHGVYQQLLATLAEEGVLIGVASKNDPAVVEQAFRRSDLLLNSQSVWPIQVQWSAKSAAVGRILEAWNIGPESVVFVDDSEMELAEVKAAYPAAECVLFPKKDYAAIYRLLWRLRDLFGKTAVTEEDGLRRESLKSFAVIREASGADWTPDAFLAAAEAQIVFSYQNPPQPRALELINKTNQFNINGRRYTEADWQRSLARPGVVAAVGSYRDKYGPLGKILALHGKIEAHTLYVEAWVMSCRAFSRRIEYKCLEELFTRFGLGEICFDFVRTERNGPTSEFFSSLLGHDPEREIRLTRERFFAKCPRLYAVVSEEVST